MAFQKNRSPETQKPRRQAKTRKGKKYRLRSGAATEVEDDALIIPVRWIKSVAGVLLLPVVWVLAKSLLHAFTRVTVEDRFWASEEFWFFSLGMVLWLIIFFGLPRPLFVYVFGHELTHYIWIKIMGGKVTRFHVSSDGGQIETDTSNFWIALAPYFIPIYSVAVILLWAAVDHLVYPLSQYNEVLFLLIGLTWGFHLTFTCWMIVKGQSDLHDHGSFFSLVVIILMNLVILTAFLVLASPTVSWASLGQELVRNGADFAAWLVNSAGGAFK